VHLHYRANLSQSTGEDWNDAQLTLSTRAPEDLDGGIPPADTVQIRGTGLPRYVPSRTFLPYTPHPCRRHSTTVVIGAPRQRPRPIRRCWSPTRIVEMSRSRSRGRNMSRSRSRSINRSRSPSRSPSRRRSPSRHRSPSRRRSPSRTRYYRCRSSSSSPRRRRSPFRGRIITSPTLRRSRASIAVSEPPQYPYHPNETVMISNDVTSISFIMDGRCSIPGDGKLHRVTIAILPFTATIHHVITPRVSFDAYLQVGLLDFRLIESSSLT
jgi:hypothetical protein